MKTEEFYPNIAYNRKRRRRYYVMFAILAVLLISMDAWFVTKQMYYLLFINLILVFFLFLTPKALAENPVRRIPVVKIGDAVTVGGKQFPLSSVKAVNAIVYLGSVGNLVENREFLEKCAASAPPTEMTGSLGVTAEVEGKTVTYYQVIENVVEALLLFVAEGGVEYSLGYSLGKEFRKSTYNLKECLAKAEPAAESKTKQLL